MELSNPEKLNQIVEEIVEGLGYQLFINDEEPENDPDRVKFRQLVQLIEMELSAELFVSTGKSDEEEQPAPDVHETRTIAGHETRQEMLPKVEPSITATAVTKTEPQSQPQTAPEKKAVGTQIRLVNHQEERSSAGTAIPRALSFSSASALGTTIAIIFLAGFLAAHYFSGDRGSALFSPDRQTSANKIATGPKDPKQLRAAKAFFMMAKSELEKKNYQAAREGFRMALSLEPDNPQYQEAFKQIEVLSKGSKKKPKI